MYKINGEWRKTKNREKYIHSLEMFINLGRGAKRGVVVFVLLLPLDENISLAADANNTSSWSSLHPEDEAT